MYNHIFNQYKPTLVWRLELISKFQVYKTTDNAYVFPVTILSFIAECKFYDGAHR